MTDQTAATTAGERLMAEADDVSGHLIGVAIGVGLIVVGAGLVIYGQSIEGSGSGDGGAAALGQQALDTANRLRQQFGR